MNSSRLDDGEAVWLTVERFTDVAGVILGVLCHNVKDLSDAFLTEEATFERHSFLDHGLGNCVLIEAGVRTNGNEGDIVLGREVLPERVDLVPQLFTEIVEPCLFLLPYELEQPLLAERLLLVVHGFSYTVGVEEERVPGFDTQFFRLDAVFEGLLSRQFQPDRKTIRVQIVRLACSAAMDDQRRVSGIGEADRVAPRIDDQIEHGDENAALHVVLDKIVDANEHIGGICGATGFGSQRRPYHRHNEGAGHAFSGNVGEHDAEVVLVDLDEVVVVAANRFGRFVACGDIKRLKGRDRGRQQRFLDVLSDLYLFFDAFAPGQMLL